MSRKMYEVEVPEAEKVGQQGGEAAVAEIDQEAAVGAALAEFGAACEAVTAKRRRVYERYRELDEKMKGPGLERITMPEADPFDLDALKKAAMETGSPPGGQRVDCRRPGDCELRIPGYGVFRGLPGGSV